MAPLSLISQLSLYVIVGLFGLFFLLLWWWQFMVLKGKAFKNPDGSVDDWHQQPIIYGIAFADVTVSCPVGIVGVVLTLLHQPLVFLILAPVAFWWFWANVMTTVTSLRFYKPKATVSWILGYPFAIILGLAYLIWIGIHFDAIIAP